MKLTEVFSYKDTVRYIGKGKSMRRGFNVTVRKWELIKRRKWKHDHPSASVEKYAHCGICIVLANRSKSWFEGMPVPNCYTNKCPGHHICCNSSVPREVLATLERLKEDFLKMDNK